MRRLILMRHAKSDWSGGDGSDHDRSLNDRGRTGAVALGDWLRDNALIPDEVLCSSAKRTRETLHQLKLPKDVSATTTRALYLATHHEMIDVLRGASGQTVLMLAHNPGTSIMAAQVLDGAPDHARFKTYPTGATLVAHFDIDDWRNVDWGTGSAVHFVTPHDLPTKE